MKRKEFTKKTRNIISSRAGYRCSFPGCKKVLIGPGNKINEFINIGECAHIFSAVPGGPRGDGGLSEENILSPENGIYLCSIHHKIIDSNDGNKYQSSTLLEYKNRHENSISKEMGDYPEISNWLSKLSLVSSNVFKNIINISFGKVTHFYGDNSSGKSFICDLLYSSLSGKYKKRISRNTFNIELYFQGIKEEKIEINIDKNNIEYLFNNEKMPFNPKGIEVVFLQQPYCSGNVDQVKEIAKCYNIDLSIMEQLLKKEYFKNSWNISNINVVTTRTVPYLARNILIDNNTGHMQNIDTCSGTEVGLFLVEVGILLSRFLSKKYSVILIIDWTNIGCFDNENLQKILTELQSNRNVFQSILVSPDEINKLKWTGWEIAHFKNFVPNTIIDQNYV